MPVILHVDPSTADRDSIRQALASQETWSVEGVESYDEARTRLDQGPVDLILCEADLGDGEWRDLVCAVNSRQLTTPVVIVSSQMTVETAAQAVREGADGVLVKGGDPNEWFFSLECAIDRATSRSLRIAAESSLNQLTQKFVLENEKGRIPSLVNLLVENCCRFGLLDDRDRMRIQVALEEALLNSVVHGNLEVSSRLRELEGDQFEQAIAERKVIEPYRSRRVTLVAHFTHTEARFTIRDEGPGFDVTKVRNPTEDDAIALASGRGILLMRSFMDDVEYNNKGNEVSMLKRRSPTLSPRTEATEVGCGATAP